MIDSFGSITRIDLTLSKKVEGRWSLVVEGDTRGEMLMDPSEVAAAHERLTHLTSEEWVGINSILTPAWHIVKPFKVH